MSIISAGTSNTTSIVYTGDTTGNLVFQSNGTTEAMRIDTNQNVGIGTSTPVDSDGFGFAPPTPPPELQVICIFDNGTVAVGVPTNT